MGIRPHNTRARAPNGDSPQGGPPKTFPSEFDAVDEANKAAEAQEAEDEANKAGEAHEAEDKM